jgi:hypothetical protein
LVNAAATEDQTILTIYYSKDDSDPACFDVFRMKE